MQNGSINVGKIISLVFIWEYKIMKNNNQKKGDLGQHWTPLETVKFMTNLLTNRGSILEPTAGSGRFVKHLIGEGFKDINAVEIDKEVIPDDLKEYYNIGNFFTWTATEQFNSIIGNPPYVNGKLIDDDTILSIKKCKKLTLPTTSNLYLHVIEKCVKYHLKQNGELVFIIPDTIMSKSSKGSRLRKWMSKNGSFTHFYKTDVEWEKASISTCIIRWVKNEIQEKVITNTGLKHVFHSEGMIYLLDYKPYQTFSNFFKVGVGSAPSKNLLLDKALGGSGFIGGKKIKYYDASCMEKWPRKRITEQKHKILFLAGPTRDKKPFYTTNDYGDIKQSSFHVDSFMSPNFKIDENNLDTLANEINDFFIRRNKDLNCRVKGRWSLGIKELSNIPMDKKLYEFLKMYIL